MKLAAGEGYATATDLADWLVRTLKMPFRDAHHVTGRIVAAASKAGVPLHELPLAEMQAIEPQDHREALARAFGRSSVKSRSSFGGTAPKNVLAQAKAWLQAAGKTAKIGLRGSQFRCNFMVVRVSPDQANLCMVPPHWGFCRDQQLPPDRSRDGPSSLLGAAVLALGGCGRKGGLDLPPNASPQPPAGSGADQCRRPTQPSVFNPDGPMRAPAAPKGARHLISIRTDPRRAVARRKRLSKKSGRSISSDPAARAMSTEHQP